MADEPKRRIAIIGLGPAGAISIDAFAQEQAFDVIRVFERRERPGGCWLPDQKPHPVLPKPSILSSRDTVDPPSKIPERLPVQIPKQEGNEHFTETSVYPYLETNVDASVMEFSQEPIPVERSAVSIARHGMDTPFRPWATIQRYIEGLVNRNGYQDLVSYSTTVESVTKVDGEWEVVLRKGGEKTDYWWKEHFDAVVVANGHYTVPYIPKIEGLDEFARKYPGGVLHTKAYRGRDAFRGKRVVVVGASVSGADTSVDLLGVAKSPVIAVVKGHRPQMYFGYHAFEHPGIDQRPSISKIVDRTVHFADGTSVEEVDSIIIGTGYSWTLPFLKNIPIRNNRVPDLYQHIFHQSDPSLVFVGAVAAGFTFKVFEWQAVLAARVLAGRAQLPSLEEQRAWEASRVKEKGDSVPFTAIHPKFEEYFETLRQLAGEPKLGQPGRRLPPFDPAWVPAFHQGHQRRIAMWKVANKEAHERRSNAQQYLARL
ncbi:hypothetical protein Q7P37_005738 [Cladosporium fusiforme]